MAGLAMVLRRPGQPPKSAELPPAKCLREPFHTAFCFLRTRIAPDSVIPRKGRGRLEFGTGPWRNEAAPTERALPLVPGNLAQPVSL